MEKAIEIMTAIGSYIEQLIAEGRLKSTAIGICATILAAAVLSLLLFRILARSRRKAAEHPAVQDAIRLYEFYLDRPLPAEIRIEYGSRRERREAMRSDAPGCEKTALEKAVWEAEYNEFVAWELENEARGLKTRHPKAPCRSMRIALRYMTDAKKRLPHGMSAVFEAGRSRRAWQYKLSAAQEWLDRISGQEPGTRRAQFRALKSNRFACAWCGADWNDGARLRAVRTKSGALVPVCARCEAAHGPVPEHEAKTQ